MAKKAGRVGISESARCNLTWRISKIPPDPRLNVYDRYNAGLLAQWYMLSCKYGDYTRSEFWTMVTGERVEGSLSHV